MARISAGSNLSNQFVPPFVISKNITTNWQLRWNDSLKAFEAFDPRESDVDAGFDSIESLLFPNTVAQQQFVLPWVSTSVESLIMTINGVKQHTDAYVITSTSATQTVITATGPVTGDVEFIGLQADGGGVVINQYSVEADGVTTSYTLDWLVPTRSSLIVTLDGIKQQTDAYAVTMIDDVSTELNFVEAPSLSITSATLVSGGTGYSTNDILTVSGGTFATAAQIRVDAQTAGVITAFTLVNVGAYSVVPSNPVSVTGGTGASATFTLTNAGQAIEVIGLTLVGGIPASPVDGFNLGSGPVEGLYIGKNVYGDLQRLNFKSLAAGDNIELTGSGSLVTIDAVVPTFANVGTGVGLVVDAGVTDPLQLRTVDGDDNRITVSVVSNTITVAYEHGYVTTGSTPYVANDSDRIIGITNGVTFAVTLPDAADVPAGDTITVKNQTASTNNITITTAAGTIDGAASYVINTAYGFVTMYSNGTNYFVISEG